MSYQIEQDELYARLKKVRVKTKEICAPLEVEDHVLQPIEYVSPKKWHLAHTTWFFEQLVLLPNLKGYKEYNPDFSYLFNSYYNSLCVKVIRSKLGFMSRATGSVVFNYAYHIVEHLHIFCEC